MTTSLVASTQLAPRSSALGELSVAVRSVSICVSSTSGLLHAALHQRKERDDDHDGYSDKQKLVPSSLMGE